MGGELVYRLWACLWAVGLFMGCGLVYGWWACLWAVGLNLHSTISFMGLLKGTVYEHYRMLSSIELQFLTPIAFFVE